MSMRRDPKQEPQHMIRRDFLNKCFSGIKRESFKTDPDGEILRRFPLSALENVPDAVLMQIVPILREGWSVQVREGGISYKDVRGYEGMVSLGLEGCTAVLLFDGIRTLEQIAASLEAKLGMTQGNGVPIVQKLFLDLAMREVYHPNSPPRSLSKALAEENKNA
jgi:hypothetical protein